MSELLDLNDIKDVKYNTFEIPASGGLQINIKTWVCVAIL